MLNILLNLEEEGTGICVIPLSSLLAILRLIVINYIIY